LKDKFFTKSADPKVRSFSFHPEVTIAFCEWQQRTCMCLTSFKSLDQSICAGEGSENRSFWIWDPGPRPVGRGNRSKIWKHLFSDHSPT
jgi:hypothetical protein